MPRFLTPAWAEAYNAALSGAALPVPEPTPDSSQRAQDGPFTVVQEVRATPDGDVRLVITVDGATMTLAVEPLDADSDEGDVTMAIAYEDAVALTQGQLSPAGALTTGRVRVRGDLSLLVASQERMEAARAAVGDLATLSADTTY